MKFIASLICIATMSPQSTSSRENFVQTPTLRGRAAGRHLGQFDIKDAIDIQARGTDIMIDEKEGEMVDSIGDTGHSDNKEGYIRGALQYPVNPLESTCRSEGIHHPDGETFTCPDGCNICWCSGPLVMQTRMNCDDGEAVPIGGGMDLNQLSHTDPHSQKGLKDRGSDEVAVATKTENITHQIEEAPIIFLDEIAVTKTETATHRIEEYPIFRFPSGFDCLYEGIHYFDGEEFLDGCNLCQCSDSLVACTKMNCDSDEKILIGGPNQLP